MPQLSSPVESSKHGGTVGLLMQQLALPVGGEKNRDTIKPSHITASLTFRRWENETILTAYLTPHLSDEDWVWQHPQLVGQLVLSDLHGQVIGHLARGQWQQVLRRLCLLSVSKRLLNRQGGIKTRIPFYAWPLNFAFIECSTEAPNWLSKLLGYKIRLMVR